MRVADYIFTYLADHGVRHVFLVTGGGAMFLNDGLRCESRLQPVCQHHEQACAMAAEGYARVTGATGVVSVTTGPGGVNALTGVYGAWTDSIPMLIISGQVKRETCMSSYPALELRQLGDQEADIISHAKVITKYAQVVDDPHLIRYHLERAWHLASAGRPGPCWLDIPLDVQASEIDPATLPAYDPAEDVICEAVDELSLRCTDILARLHRAQRPVILAGNGIRCAGGVGQFRNIAARLGIPVVLSRTACDLLAYTDPHYCGRGGIDADRAGNLVVQNADLLLILGSRLNTRQTGYEWNGFARAAEKIWVNIDAEEFKKKTVPIEETLHCDLRDFLPLLDEMLAADQKHVTHHHVDWLQWCKKQLDSFDPYSHMQHGQDLLNPYLFLQECLQYFADDEVIVCGNGSAFIMVSQVARLQPRQRLFFNSGCASMGYDLPAAIGAAFAHGKRVICFAGDGSLMMNLQELQTLAQHRLPVKLFILNNNGYLSIRTSQSNYFHGFIGESPQSGISFPNFTTLATAFGLSACTVDARSDLAGLVPDLLAQPGPTVCNVLVDPCQSFEPRMQSKILPNGEMLSPPLEDMYPFLSPEELQEHMWIPLGK